MILFRIYVTTVRKIVTQQPQESFSTMQTACKFSEMPLFICLLLRLGEACLKSLKANVKTSTRYTCRTDLDLAYLLTQSQF